MNIPSTTRTAPSAMPLGGTSAVDSGSSTPERPQVSLTLVGCFDLAGDGQINSRSALDGGDATLLVPSHEVDLPTWPHAALLHALDATHDQPDHITTAPTASATAGMTRRAVDAYQRYGPPNLVRGVLPKAVESNTGARLPSRAEPVVDHDQHPSP